MKVSVLLADKGTANPHAGTLNLLNVGWSQTQLQVPQVMGPGMVAQITPPHAVVVFFEVEPHRCNHPIELIVRLLNEDGSEVTVPGPTGPQPLRLVQPITVPTPGGMPSGSPGTGNTMIEIHPGLPLAAGGYVWKVTLDGEDHEDWSARFRVTALPVMPVFGAQPPPD